MNSSDHSRNKKNTKIKEFIESFFHWVANVYYLQVVIGLISLSQIYLIYSHFKGKDLPFPVWIAYFIWIISIFITAILTKVVLTKRLLKQKLELYGTRNNSDKDFEKDVAKYKYAIFIGISQTHLSDYINKISLQNDCKIEEIDVYFASKEDGELWQGNSFLESVKKSRWEIAATITTPEIASVYGKKIKNLKKRIKNFKSITFRQLHHHSTYGGVILCNKKGEPSLQYLVIYLAGETRDTEKKFTIKILHSLRSNHSKEKGNDPLLSLKEAYQDLAKHAVNLGRIIPSIWDVSAEKWDIFTTNCAAYHLSMRRLINFAGISDGKTILEIGCGTGYLSKFIIEHSKNIELWLLDSSPQMLRKARKLGDNFNYVLWEIPNDTSVHLLDIPKEVKFDHILIHLSIPSLASTPESIEKLAVWCKLYMKENGFISLANHNTAVKTEKDQYVMEQDPLRKAIRKQAKELKLKVNEKSPSYYFENKAVIIDEFKKNGFKLESQLQENYKMTMDDRIKMWSCPSVMKNIIDIDDLSDNNIQKIIEKVSQEISGLPTPDMIVTYFKFGIEKENPKKPSKSKKKK